MNHVAQGELSAEERRIRRRFELKNIAAMAIFGTIGVVVNLTDIPSAVLVGARAVIGVAFILLVSRLRGVELRRDEIARNLKPLVVGGVALGLNWLFLFEAYRHTSVAVATVCNYLAPVIVALIAPYITGEARSLPRTLGAVVALIGAVCVSGAQLGMGRDDVLGILCGLASAAGYVVIIFANKRVSGLSGYESSAVQLTSAAAVILPYVIATTDFAALNWTPLNIGITLLLGVVHTGLAYILYLSALSHLPAQTSGLLAYTDPALSITLSAIVLGQILTPLQIFGVALIFGALITSEVIDS